MFEMKDTLLQTLVISIIFSRCSAGIPNDDYRGPTFLIEPPGRVIFSNSTGVAIPCTADGKPPANITWTKHDGKYLENIPSIRHVRHDGSLAFLPFHSEDYRADIHAAAYRCTAGNVIGLVGSRDVHVRAVIPQKYEIRLFDEYVLRGNMALLRCPIPSFVSDYVRVTSWERADGFLISPSILSGKYGMLDNGDLYVRDVTEQDGSHSFRCHTENIVTKERRASVNYSRIVVSEPHHRQAPRIIRQVSVLKVQAGSRAILSCVAQGFPTPIYRWQRISENTLVANFDLSSRQQGGLLQFHNVVATDGGKYLCTASNSMGEDKVETELIVEEPVSVSIYPREIRADVGKSVTFNCSVSNIPNTRNVVWRKDMQPILQNSRTVLLNPTSLQIRRLGRNDAGMYQCFVSTEKQSEQASARLIIGDLAAKLKVTFSEKTVTPGSYVSFSCVASGNPLPHIRWTLDNIWPLTSRPGIVVSSHMLSHGDVISYVNITSADVVDSGLYRCEAVNDAGYDSHSRRLNVYGPIMMRALINMTAVAGDDFMMLCPFGGYPFDTIGWKKDGNALPMNQRQRVFTNGSMLIQDVEPGVDDGEYTCEVSSGQGAPAQRTFRLIIRSRPKLSAFAFQDNLHEGMRTAVTCIVLAGDPPFTLRWTKDGMPLNDGVLDTSIFHHENAFVTTLVINTLAYIHNGNYTCLASNDFATGSQSAKLVVKVPPRWVIEPRDTSATAGLPAKIDCQAEGVPQPHIRWKSALGPATENFKTIVSSSHVHILANGSLNFRNVEYSDAGVYLCEASNGVGAVLSKVVTMKVHSAPQFQTKFMVLTARRGQRTIIECRAHGDKPMAFSWLKNGLTLEIESEQRLAETKEDTIDGSLTKLVINKADRKDSALFSCNAINDYGEDTMNVQLTVQDIPDAPQNLEVHDVGSRSVRLTWNRPFDGNSPITQWTVMWRQLNDKLIGGPQVVPGSENTLTIRGLSPRTRYFFRVNAENAIGTSQFSAEVAVTTLEEPPRKTPQYVKAIPLSSGSVNVTWQNVLTERDSESVNGFYVGYKVKGSQVPYTFKPADISQSKETHSLVIYGLERYTQYNIVVQAFNDRGAGPPSEVATVRTLEYDPPGVPVIKDHLVTSRTIKLSWDIKNVLDSPVSGYVLYHRTEGSDWEETHLTGDRTYYTLHDLRCGTRYFMFLVAFNSAGRGNASEIVTVKSHGNAPIAPDKHSLMTVNSSSVFIRLASWSNGGCPISSFVVQYKVNGQREWTLVSNNILPSQQNITIGDLTPGTWYSLLMTARNDAGNTDAEYIFPTLTLKGEFPPHPSEVSDAMGITMYRHLTITVPAISSLLMLAVIVCVVCLVTRRKFTGCQARNSNANTENENTKSENVPLSVTYGSKQEPIYFPSPYAATRVPATANADQIQSQPPGTQGMGTFGSTRSGYTYDIPYPTRRAGKDEETYDPPVIYFPAYHHIGVEIRTEAIYEVPDRGRAKHNEENSRCWREGGDGSSSNDSDNEDLFYTPHSAEQRVILDEARESETECDRLWKIFEESHYEGHKRWTGDRAVLT